MKWIFLLLALLAVASCGPSASTTASRTGPDVVTAEWTSGDDAPLDPQGTTASSP